MRNFLSTTALTALVALSSPAFAQLPGQAPVGPLPMTQPAPGTPSTSQRPSTAAGALGATSGHSGSTGTGSMGQPSAGQSSIGQSESQPRAGQPGALAENDVRDLLRTDGYSDVQNMSRDGNNYRARAMQNGRSVDLTVDAYTGTVRSQAARR